MGAGYKELGPDVRMKDSQSSEQLQEDKYGFEDYYKTLLDRISGVPSDEARGALRELYNGWKEVNSDWLEGLINPTERSDRRYEVVHEFGKKYDALFKNDPAFQEAVFIVRDETG